MSIPPISVVVVSRDEAHLLPRCLGALSFCDEVIVVDLDSSDDTAEVARRLGARVVRHPAVPLVEMAREATVGEAANPWLLMVDPDEVVDQALADDLARLLPTLPSTVSGVSVPWRFYFRGKPLRGTVWGGTTQKPILVHRDRVDFAPDVHRGMRSKPGFGIHALPSSGRNVLHHYWMTGYADWLRKHLRYVREERAARRRRDVRVNVLTLLLVLPGRFVESFIVRRGYRDGFRGVLLSACWAGYNLAAVSTSPSLRAPLRLRKLGSL